MQFVRNMLRVCAMILLCSTFVVPEYAQTTTQFDRQVFLAIDEAIALALKNNLELQAKQYDPEIKREDIRKAEAAFDLSLKTTGAQVFNEAPSPSTSPANATSLDLTLSKRLSTGGSIQVGLGTSRSGIDTTGLPPTVADTQYETSLKVTVAQALLKGRGTEINRTPIIIAQRQREVSLSELRAKITEIVSKIKTTYWKLIYVRGDLEARRLSLQLAYDLVKINEAQVRVGTLAPIEVLQAQATAASREVDIISAEQTVQDVEDELKRLLNVSKDDPTWNASIVPTDTPVSTRQSLSMEESIQMALQNSEQLQQLQKAIEIQEISLKASHNQLLPDFNLSGTFSMTGKDEGFGGALEEFVGFERFSVTIGASFSYPVGNREVRSSVNKAKLELDKTRLSIENVEQVLTTSVKQAIRGVETSYRLVEASNVALQLAQQQLDAEQKKFKEGLSTNFQVLSLQGSLASARSRYTQAITSYNQALVGLDQATGMTLKRHNILVKE